MKTKLTLLLALALSTIGSQAQAQNLNPKAAAQARSGMAQIQGFQKPAIAPQPTAPRPASPVRQVAPSRNVPAADLLRLAPSVLNALRPPLQSFPPGPASNRGSAKPSSQASGAVHAAPKQVIKPAVTPAKNSPRPVVPGLGIPNAAGLLAGREIAEGLRALESLRHSGLQGLRPDGFGIPSGGGNSLVKPSIPGENESFSPRTPTSPIRPGGRSNGLTDIRAGFGSSRRGNGTTGLSATGDRVLESEVSIAAGRSGTSTPVESTTHPNGDVTASTTATSPDGTTTYVEVTEHANGSGTTTTTHGNDGRTDTLTITRRDARGDIITTTTSTVYPGGKEHVVTRDGSGRVTAEHTEYFTPGARRSGDRSPAEGASLGGPVNGTGPSVADVTGLMPLDLLRQHAHGESANGGANTMTSGSLGSRHVNPDRNGNNGPSRNRLRVDAFGTISNPAPLGGEGAAGGGSGRPE
ncbi:MAG: hypothetical protein LDL31_02190 [Prosthecobacter sp.]|jgi:hypothetical protein|nr:hypothetical protein [Prosthecobacter sp.]